MRPQPRLLLILCIIFVCICVSFFVFRRPNKRKLLTAFEIEQLDALNLLDPPDHKIQIPRIIHQTWKTRQVPLRWNKTVQSIIELNRKHFEYRLWTDEDMHRFVKEKDAEFYRDTFLTYPLDIQRVDAFRYFILYYLGGLYIDMDNGAIKSLHTLFNALEMIDPQGKHYCAFPRTTPVGVSNGFMISTRGHPLFRRLISHLSWFNHRYVVDYLTVMLSAGPLYLSLHEFYFRSPKNVHVRVIDEIVYSSIYTWHTPGSSWHGRDAKILLYIYYKILMTPQCMFVTVISSVMIFLYVYFRLSRRKLK